jgi:hypothetical protein
VVAQGDQVMLLPLRQIVSPLPVVVSIDGPVETPHQLLVASSVPVYWPELT